MSVASLVEEAGSPVPSGRGGCHQCDNCGVVLFYPKKVEPLEHGKWIEENSKLCDKVCDGKLTTTKEILEAQYE